MQATTIWDTDCYLAQVIGIEMNEAAVADACTNAEINGIKNCRFVCGKVLASFNG